MLSTCGICQIRLFHVRHMYFHIPYRMVRDT